MSFKFDYIFLISILLTISVLNNCGNNKPNTIQSINIKPTEGSHTPQPTVIPIVPTHIPQIENLVLLLNKDEQMLIYKIFKEKSDLTLCSDIDTKKNKKLEIQSQINKSAYYGAQLKATFNYTHILDQYKDLNDIKLIIFIHKNWINSELNCLNEFNILIKKDFDLLN